MDDLTGLPTVQWPDIYTYLIEKPSVHTKEKLKAYKSLHAYNYILNEHVQDLKYKNLTDDFCGVRSKVLPSQRQGQKTTTNQTRVTVKRKKKATSSQRTALAWLGK